MNPEIPVTPVATSASSLAQTSFTANWNSVGNATEYKLYIDGVLAYTGSNLTFSKTDLVINTSHSYYVQASNISGTSGNSNTINVTLLTTPTTTDLVAYYPFNGNANDASGYNHNGTVVGAYLTTDRFGNTGKWSGLFEFSRKVV